MALKIEFADKPKIKIEPPSFNTGLNFVKMGISYMLFPCCTSIYLTYKGVYGLGELTGAYNKAKRDYEEIKKEKYKL